MTFATDEFFGCQGGDSYDSAEPVFVEDKYDDHGKWMDGWESRRKPRRPGHDYCVVSVWVSPA